jgi:hypothetical protein
MKNTIDFFSISKFGSISILGITLGMDKDDVYTKLKDYNIQEYKNIFSIKTLNIENIKISDELLPINIFFELDNNLSKVEKININSNNLNNAQIEKLYIYFKKILCGLEISMTEEKNKDVTKISYSNAIHHIFLLKNLSSCDNSNKNYVFLSITSKFENSEKLQENIYKLYTNENSTFIEKQNLIMSSELYRIFKIVLCVVAIIIFGYIGYKHELNNRYYYQVVNGHNRPIVYDKWKGNCFILTYPGDDFATFSWKEEQVTK